MKFEQIYRLISRYGDDENNFDVKKKLNKSNPYMSRILICLSSSTVALGSTQPLTEMSTRNLPGQHVTFISSL
jgi:hypothetical protein